MDLGVKEQNGDSGILTPMSGRKAGDILVERLRELVPDGQVTRVATRAGISMEHLLRLRKGESANVMVSTLQGLADATGKPVAYLISEPTETSGKVAVVQSKPILTIGSGVKETPAASPPKAEPEETPPDMPTAVLDAKARREAQREESLATLIPQLMKKIDSLELATRSTANASRESAEASRDSARASNEMRAMMVRNSTLIEACETSLKKVYEVLDRLQIEADAEDPTPNYQVRRRR